ncbi:hypothetical protein Tco_0349274 [Tanacetum coccineum]
MLKVSPRKGIIRFGKRGKLNPRYIGPFKILKRISPVAYKLKLPEELRKVPQIFPVSNLKKCLSNESLVIPMKELQLDDKLNFVEEPVEIMDREVKQLRQSRIPIVKPRGSVVDYEDEYQGELQGDSQEDKLTTAVMLLARAITQKNAGRQNRNQAFNPGTGNDESNQIVQRVPQTKSNPGKENVQEQMLLVMKDEAGSNLKDEENDFMLDNSYGDETLEELTVAVIMMARIQSADDNAASEPSYDAKAASEVNASARVHEQVNRVQHKTIIHTSDNDQIDSNSIFDDPCVENNGGTSEHD